MEQLIKSLRKGFRGAAPESNLAGFLELRVAGACLSGECFLNRVRLGWLNATPLTGDISIVKGGNFGTYGDIPDISINYKYQLTPLGEMEMSKLSQDDLKSLSDGNIRIRQQLSDVKAGR